jgi:hypothetical protein
MVIWDLSNEIYLIPLSSKLYLFHLTCQRMLMFPLKPSLATDSKFDVYESSQKLITFNYFYQYCTSQI